MKISNRTSLTHQYHGHYKELESLKSIEVSAQSSTDHPHVSHHPFQPTINSPFSLSAVKFKPLSKKIWHYGYNPPAKSVTKHSSVPASTLWSYDSIQVSYNNKPVPQVCLWISLRSQYKRIPILAQSCQPVFDPSVNTHSCLFEHKHSIKTSGLISLICLSLGFNKHSMEKWYTPAPTT